MAHQHLPDGVLRFYLWAAGSAAAGPLPAVLERADVGEYNLVTHREEYPVRG